MNFDRQNILTIVLILALAAGGYIWYSYFLSGGEKTAPANVNSPVSEEFLLRAELLNRIKIDTEFFRSPVFLELKAGEKLPPLPEVRGRANPFGQF